MSTRAHSIGLPGARPTRPAPRSSVELRAVLRLALGEHRRTILAWGMSLGALTAFMAGIYPTIQDSIEQMIKSYPTGLKEAFGANEMSTVEGYIHAEMFSLIVPLAIGYFAARAVAAMVVGAEERGYLDTLLALPLSRRTLMGGAYAAAALLSAAILAVIGALTYLVGLLAGTDISLGLVTAGVVGVWPIALFVGGVSALACGALHSSRAVSGIAIGTLVGMYALDLAGRLAHSLDALRWVSVFRYYGAPLRDGLDPVAFAGVAGAGILLAVAGALLLERRDVLH